MQGKFVTIRFLNFTGFQAKRHAFAEMGRSLVQCWSAPGLLFAKHLGTGAGNGFLSFPILVYMLGWAFGNHPKKLRRFFLRMPVGFS